MWVWDKVMWFLAYGQQVVNDVVMVCIYIPAWMPEEKGMSVKSQQGPAIRCPAEWDRHTQGCVQICQER